MVNLSGNHCYKQLQPYWDTFEEEDEEDEEDSVEIEEFPTDEKLSTILFWQSLFSLSLLLIEFTVKDAEDFQSKVIVTVLQLLKIIQCVFLGIFLASYIFIFILESRGLRRPTVGCSLP